MTASVTRGRALRYAEGSARGLLHHVLGHCPEPRLHRTQQLRVLVVVLLQASNKLHPGGKEALVDALCRAKAAALLSLLHGQPSSRTPRRENRMRFQ